MKLAARIISLVFHPLLFPTYLVLALAWFTPRFLLIPATATMKFTGLVFAMTFILPAANLLMFKAFGTIPSLEMLDRRERLLPFILITVVYAVVAAMFFYKVSVNVNFNKVMLIQVALGLTATLATFYDKVSIHSMAIWGAVGIFVPLNKAVADGSLFVPTAVMLVVAGTIMSSRLYLNAHTPRQIMYGAFLGFSVAFTGMLLLF
jgi:membrane-associated phospholipid phosphatase